MSSLVRKVSVHAFEDFRSDQILDSDLIIPAESFDDDSMCSLQDEEDEVSMPSIVKEDDDMSASSTSDDGGTITTAESLCESELDDDNQNDGSADYYAMDWEELAKMPNLYHRCPTLGCTNMIYWKEGNGPPIGDCFQCKRTCCLKCNISPFHDDKTCEEHLSRLARSNHQDHNEEAVPIVMECKSAP